MESPFATSYPLESLAGILVTRRYATYKDQPGRLYHYPKRLYESVVQSLRGCLVLTYEPRRGGTSETSMSGGRSAFTGFAFLGDQLMMQMIRPTASFRCRATASFRFP